MTVPYFYRNDNSRFLSVEGKDSSDFLQNLITNDVYKCTKENIIYSCLLTPQGKFIADFFIFKKDDKFIIEIHSFFYATFLNRKNRSMDVELLTASYFLYYDKNESAFVVSGYDTLSNVFRLYDKQCKTKGDGLMDLGVSLGRIGIETAGFAEYNILSDKEDLRLFLLLDFFFSEKALEIMAEDIFLSPGIENFDFESEFYAKTLGIF